jgi:hypothetical protein
MNVIQGVSKIPLLCKSECYYASSVTKSLHIKAHKLSIVQDVEDGQYVRF